MERVLVLDVDVLFCGSDQEPIESFNEELFDLDLFRHLMCHSNVDLERCADYLIDRVGVVAKVRGRVNKV